MKTKWVESPHKGDYNYVQYTEEELSESIHNIIGTIININGSVSFHVDINEGLNKNTCSGRAYSVEGAKRIIETLYTHAKFMY